jgi:hypothetical protein
MNRLHLAEITSIGAVEEGDDPEAQIVLYKSKSAPTATGKGSLGSGSARPGPEWGPLIEQITLAKLAEQSVKIGKIRDGLKEMGDTMAQTMTAAQIGKAVHTRAAALRSRPEHWDRTEVELRAEVWKRTPGLRDAYTDAARDPDRFQKSSGGEHSKVLATIRAWADES